MRVSEGGEARPRAVPRGKVVDSPQDGEEFDIVDFWLVLYIEPTPAHRGPDSLAQSFLRISLTCRPLFLPSIAEACQLSGASPPLRSTCPQSALSFSRSLAPSTALLSPALLVGGGEMRKPRPLLGEVFGVRFWRSRTCPEDSRYLQV